ncbi:Aste57867_21408 [Aphanomyces stellatus]|uniref:Ribosome assembly protein 3 n=1 Tax=Aphanomyces stellatus TaxID=120398 RepID=A0A485LIQ4_9STRA|nr:hypothetical protein As57867_021339 [Aphanomyces stellatus]VFT98079.1 Aste57867_21408 [Aphanomyces stellatus]
MAGYGELIKRLGESPLDEASAIEKLEDVAQLLQEKDRAAVVEEAVEKTMRCADLIDKALRLAHKFNQSGDTDEEISDAYGHAVKELIVMDKNVDDFAKTYASSGVFTDASKASRALLARADENVAEDNSSFHDLYMEDFATVFGDELDKFRQDDAFEEKDVSFLISCIKGGADVFAPLEQALFVESAKRVQ